MRKSATGQPILQSAGLTKDFGAGKGIFDVDFTLQAGQVLGFVGPNGAGKSTTITILTGLTRPDKGSATLFGQPDMFNNYHHHATKIGVMFSELTLDDSLSAQQAFEQSQQLLGHDYSDEWQRMSQLLDLDLLKPIKQLSLGNKKKVGIVHALMHHPELIIMDEPTSGLDPIIKDKFVQLIRQAVADGAGVLLSSHDLTEIQEVSDQIIMIKNGRIILNKSTNDILGLAQRAYQLIQPPDVLVRKLENLVGVPALRKTAGLLSFETSDYAAVTQLLASEKFFNFYIEKPNLEDSFKEYYE